MRERGISPEFELLTCEEAAAFLRVHERTVGRLLKSGQLRGVKVGRQWRIRRADLEAFVRGEAGNAPRRIDPAA